MAVTAGGIKTASDIAGVLVRLPWVYEHELGHIALADRAYAAAEMNAFLLTWLSELPCSILNRPTPQCLFGPSWRQEKWIYIAAQLGIPVTQMCRAADFSRDLHSNIQQSSPGSIAVTVVGKRCLSCADQELTSHALRLALAANVELLTVFFTGSESGSKFLGASLWPDITNEEIAEAILAYFARANKDAL